MDEVKKEEGNSVELLVSLRDQTRRTGILYPEQSHQLKYWPRIISECVSGCETKFSFEDSSVEYDLVVKGKIPKDMEERVKQLIDWTQFLFGSEYSVKVKANGKILFKGKRLKEPPVKKNKDGKEYLDDLKEDYETDKYKMSKFRIK